MNNTPCVYAMIVAAGRGSRFGSSVPKQYLPLNGQTLLQHSVARLAGSAYIHDCLLIIAADDTRPQNLDFALPVWYAIGGAERWQSVYAGLDAIIKKGGVANDLILIHDAARPTVPSRDIDQVIDAAKLERYGAILATPVADTLKKSQYQPHTQSKTESKPVGKNNANSNDYVERTIDRNGLWQAQTPQVFRIDQLHRVLTYVAEHNLHITDEASAFEHLGLPIRLVTGSRQNIKLTYPDDAILLSAILMAQSSAL
ncbi:2-C-methyl-D-erythritol 4-phosphate cytidylyltransferase [Psychrobacter sp. PL15]|uniref:2-C-methyl-D-erythritol 4-phosphate cytidylyltransferase n=1 Tax=Psychrobacter sp. PL15 TaxID=3071719 RepID=UPI002E042F34|nr:2-C-methyl-D-erythritol 4-phosphate cytidylyltransferase [Psychrobacter sp. PL15]